MSDYIAEPVPESSIFDGMQPSYRLSTTGQRFLHLLVDYIISYAIVLVLYMVAFAIVPAWADYFANDESLSVKLMDRLVSAAGLVLVYTLVEGATKGRTLGKLLTKSVAIREDGLPLTWKNALMRSLSRVVPFDALSGLSGYPWHDKWTKTLVVRKDSIQRPI
jgi:uncharacterized RDD family membrane protein YckC